MSNDYEKMVIVKQYNCLRCKHKWEPRKEQPPVSCPACKSPFWNRPRKEHNKTAKEE